MRKVTPPAAALRFVGAGVSLRGTTFHNVWVQKDGAHGELGGETDDPVSMNSVRVQTIDSSASRHPTNWCCGFLLPQTSFR